MTRRIFKMSKGIHKWLGLMLILFLVWMSASGILLNHPEWIAGLSVPGWLVPPQYFPENWNRSALIDLTYAADSPDILYVGGKYGLWRSTNGGKDFQPFEAHFEPSFYYKKTKDLYLDDGTHPFLLAATDGGLWLHDLKSESWQPLKLGTEREAVRRILTVKDRLLVFSESNAYMASGEYPDFQFQKMEWSRLELDRRITLVDLFFNLHDGRIWGLPGKLLFDLAGVVIIFLSISAFYIWYFPNKMRYFKKRKKAIDVPRQSRFYRVFLKYHLRLGILLAGILFIIAGTGFFMRPPLLALIAEGSVPASAYPGLLPKNPWHEKVHNVLFDAVENKLIINCTDGTWVGPADFSAPFVQQELDVPIFVMGATVFEAYGQGGYLVGSFNGLFHWERSTARPFDLMRGEYARDWSNVRPDDFMVTGYFRTPQGNEWITTHEQGLIPLPGQETDPNRFLMPEALKHSWRMPLWNFMFELHNGRIFKDWIGGWYILLVPLGALFFLLIIISGVFDWFFLKLLKRKLNKKALRL